MPKQRTQKVELNSSELLQLQQLIQDPTATPNQLKRARTLLSIRAGFTIDETTNIAGVSPASVSRWCASFQADGLDVVLRKTASRRNNSADPAEETNSTVEEVPIKVKDTNWSRKPTPQKTIIRLLRIAQSTPPKDVGRWTQLALAERVGISTASVRRILRNNNIQLKGP